MLYEKLETIPFRVQWGTALGTLHPTSECVALSHDSASHSSFLLMHNMGSSRWLWHSCPWQLRDPDQFPDSWLCPGPSLAVIQWMQDSASQMKNEYVNKMSTENVLLKRFIYLEVSYREGERGRHREKDLPCAGHYPGGHSSQCCARPKPGVRSFFPFSCG